MGLYLILQHFQIHGFQLLFCCQILQLLLVQPVQYFSFFLQSLDIFSGGIFHFIEGMHQFSQFILIVCLHVFHKKLIGSNLLGGNYQFNDRIHHRMVQHLCDFKHGKCQ